MANTYVDTGHGATLDLATTGASFNWTSIDCGEQTINDIDISHLASTNFRQYFPGDLREPNEITVPYQWDTAGAQISTGVVEDITITFPNPVGSGTPANLIGTGYIKRIKYPNLQTDQIQDGELTIMFDGGRGGNGGSPAGQVPLYTEYAAGA